MIHRSTVEDSQSGSNKKLTRNSIKILIDNRLLPEAVASVDRGKLKCHEKPEHCEDSMENHKPVALNCRSGELNGFIESETKDIVGHNLPKPQVACDQGATDLKTIAGRKRRIALNGDDVGFKSSKSE